MKHAAETIQQLKSQGRSVGLCNGGFDVTHPGHVKHFESAKRLCDVLMVAVTADRFVAGRKGSGRPVYTEKLRAYMIACLEFVDYVFISDFKSGVEIIAALKPSCYIKGPDYINKTTPGITAEREAIQSVGGEIKYTDDPPMSTTKIIDYIKTIDTPTLLIAIDRDGTLIKNNDFLGKNNNWAQELELNTEVISYLSYLQTKYKTTKVVVTNQSGVARDLFTCQRVEEIHRHINSQLALKGIKIDHWQYCPDVDKTYAEAKKNELTFNQQYVKEQTARKPSPEMVHLALQQLKTELSSFTHLLVLGDREEDEGLAKNLKAKFIDVKDKKYEELVKEFS
ncbi:HAD-IIIA family hydrolase [Candidatus Woesearchaeota archaeon]|nr:HAD-IIIA family hydrolase [Candidatus Woesearchaeota archaeon]